MSTRTTGHQISEVSALTGFSTSALRYYEGAGLVEPARTPAGYRLYDDRDVEWLRFIGRAKDFGLSLEDIAELLPIWDGDQCGAVARRLAARVAEKVDETRTRIVQLAAFASELERARSRLADDVVPGPCDATCACTLDPTQVGRAPSVAVSTEGATAKVVEAAPFACTLTPGRVVDRIEDWAELLTSQTGTPQRRTDVTTASVTVTFGPGPDIAARAAELAADEQACCSFIDFALTIDRSGTQLTASTSLEAAPIIDALLGSPPTGSSKSEVEAG